MAEQSSQTRQIQLWIDRLHRGDEAARKELINSACQRLERLTRKMLRAFPRVRRWEETGDVMQNAAVRLYRALGELRPPTVQDFFRLAALNIRRELLDLAAHYYGPQGAGAHHVTLGERDPERNSRSPLEKPAADDEPARMAVWTEFHRQVEALPDEERELFDLIWYQGLSQAEAAEILKVSERTIKRRWRSARLKLHDALHGQLPGIV